MKRTLIVACALLAACGTDPVPPAAEIAPVAKAVAVDPPLEVAVVSVPAVRSTAAQATDTVPPPPPPTARQVCNSLVWQHDNPAASDVCFRVVTAERGWSAAKTESWMHFVVHDDRSLIRGESMYCWNLRNGGIIDPYSNCVITRQGRGEDTGLGQATSVWYGPNGPLCTDYGYCGSASILASPYDSMLASVVLLIEIDSADPWCFRSPWNAYDYHACWNAPDR